MNNSNGTSGGIPGLDHPVKLHSSRNHTCNMTRVDCIYRNDRWRNWYQADRVYALGTVYFYLTIITVFMIIHLLARFSTTQTRSSPLVRRFVAGFRYISYKTYNIKIIRWFSPSLGVMILLFSGFLFLTIMAFAPKPYYWPNTKAKQSNSSPPLGTRTGWMALALLPLIMMLGSKMNYLTLLCGVSHEKLQVYHQWVSYMMYILALIHTFPYIIYHQRKGDMSQQWNTSVAYWTGVVALLAQTWLTFAALVPIRRRWYEFFKSTHLIAAVIFIIFFFVHCDFRLPSWDYFIASVVIYFSALLYSKIRTFFVYGMSHQAFVTPLPSGMLRVQIPVQLANKIGLRMIWHTGQHVFVRFQTLGLHALTLHPFAICSLPPTMHKDERCEVVLFITPKGGITKKLAEMAEESPGTAVPVLLDGPYGGLTVKTLAQFDRAVIFAGGEGAGFTLPIIEDILHRKDFEKRGPGRVTRIRVIIAIRSLEMRDWYLMEMQRLLYRYLSAEFLKVDIYITSSSLRHSIYNKAKKFDDWTIRANVSISSSLNIFEDRPKIAQIIEEVSVTPYETVGVVACGPAEMIHDVQVAVAEAQLQILRGRGTSEIYLHTESFEW